MTFHTKDIIEHIRIKFSEINKSKINLKLYIILVENESDFILIAPSISVSGYGKTDEEAHISFKHNLEIFGRDILELSQAKRDQYLLSLGFKQEKFRNKNFSKMYIDENGILQGFESSKVKPSLLEAVI